MNYLILSRYFADSYGCGAYGNGGYNTNVCASTTTGGLASTGTDVAIGIGIGIILIIIALVIIFKTRKKK